MRRRLFDLQAKILGITRSQWWVLGNLSRHKDGIMQTELATLLDVGKVSVGGIVDRLEASGYVVRKPDANDRRAKHVHITPLGHKVLQQLTVLGRIFNHQVCEGVSEREIKLTEKVLSIMKSNIKRLSGPGLEAPEDDED
jgi:DNA-binding MarR family transcriptional regulator